MVTQIPNLSQPVPQAALLLALGLLLLGFRQYRAGVLAALLGAAWVTVCATPAFARMLQQGLENQSPRAEADDHPAADAIVVLGGGDPLPCCLDAGASPHSLKTTRTGFGLLLFRRARAPIVLLSGGAGEALEMADGLARLGVPARSLRMESRSTTTYENARYSAAMLKHEGRQRILLVTSVWAMPRAAAAFRRQGLEVFPAPSFDSVPMPTATAAWRPQRASLRQSGRFLHEYFGLWYYQLRGWA